MSIARRIILALAGLLAASLGALPASSAGDPAAAPLGLWLTEKKGVLIDLYPCRNRVCGRIVWMAKPYRRSGELRRDKHNPDRSLRSRPWCGSEVIKGLKVNGNGSLEDGRFYYLGDGRTYSLDLEPNGGGTMTARAYLGIKLLGKSETWTRPGPEITPGCPTAARG